ncbi:MAG: hypothetical protein AAFO88_08540, partial [Pseudomonadota bacterium]
MTDCCGMEEPHEHGDDGEVIVKEGVDEATVAAAKALESENYSAGFSTDIEMDLAPKGLNE